MQYTKETDLEPLLTRANLQQASRNPRVVTRLQPVATSDARNGNRDAYPTFNPEQDDDDDDDDDDMVCPGDVPTTQSMPDLGDRPHPYRNWKKEKQQLFMALPQIVKEESIARSRQSRG